MCLRSRARRSSSSSSSRAARNAASSDWPLARSSWQRSSRCCESSSAISASRVGARFNGASLRRISAFHSGIFSLRDPIDASNKFAPPSKLRSQNSPPLPREPIVPAAPLVGFFDPAPLYPAAPFEAVQERVERSHMETNRSARALLNELTDFIAVTRACFNERKNQHFGAASLPLRLGQYGVHIWASNILKTARPRSQVTIVVGQLPQGH